MNNRLLSLLIASALIIPAINADNENPSQSDLLSECKEGFNYAQQEAEKYWNKPETQKKVNDFKKEWDTESGYVGGLTGIIGFFAATRIARLPIIRNLAPIAVGAGFAVWAAKEAKNCVEVHFPKKSTLPSDSTQEKKNTTEEADSSK